MRQLLLLRHAKSAWHDPGLADRERPLNRRGRRAAELMGDFLREAGLLPDRALVSTALRTQQTWQLMLARWGELQPPASLLDSLYLAPVSRLLAQLRRAPATASRLLLIGHNPGLESLARRLAGRNSAAGALNRLTEKYPTAGLAVFAVQAADWSALDPAGCRLERFVVPRDLAADGGDD